MATVYIPALLRDLTAGREMVVVPGGTVHVIVAQLDAAYPGVRQRLCDGDRLRPGLNVAVDGQIATRGLLHPVLDSSEVHFIPAIAGG